jgi:hypothetical protein
VNKLHLFPDKNLLARQVIIIWVILTLGVILSATLATLFTTVRGISPEKSVGISLILVGLIVVLVYIVLYRSGYLPFEVLNTWAQYYPFKKNGSRVNERTSDIRDDYLFPRILNSYSEPEELVENTLKALFAERTNTQDEPEGRGKNYSRDKTILGWVKETKPSILEAGLAVDYYEQVRRRYLSLFDELEKSHLKRKTRYPLALDWSQAKEVVEGQERAEKLAGFAFLDSIKNLPARQPRISLLSYVSGVDPVDIASALNIHPTEVPRWYNSGLKLLQEDLGLVRKLEAISTEAS